MNNEFQVGQTYRCSSRASGKCSFGYRVASRTASVVRLVGDTGKAYRLKIVVCNNVERCFPNQRLKLGLILTAHDLVTA